MEVQQSLCSEGGTRSVSGGGYGLQSGFGDAGDVDEEVASINQGEDNALGALFGEDAAAVGPGVGQAGAGWSWSASSWWLVVEQGLDLHPQLPHQLLNAGRQ
jgi:hypothetical protein